LILHLLPFSQAAMQQGMAIEEPSEPIDPPVLEAAVAPGVTIGEYYERLDAALAALPASAWTANRNQITDDQFFAGQLFAVNNYVDAHRAIGEIVSEGEGTPVSPNNPGSPLDFENDLAHYYRFWEIERNQLLVKDPNPVGYAWGGPLGVDWQAVYPAIADPETHDFSIDPPAAQQAQAACNAAFTAMVDALTTAFSGNPAGLGIAVRAMFDLRMAAIAALKTPLADGTSVAGPAFLYLGAQQAAALQSPCEQGDAA
ncbi:MAG TPA: ferritin-like domain-containing protein, partial [Croceibacterium sp.]